MTYEGENTVLYLQTARYNTINVSVKMLIVVFLDTWTSCTLRSFPPLGWQTMWLTLPLTTLFRRGLLWELLNSFLIHTSYWRHTDSEPEGSVASVAARLAQLVEHQTFNLRVKGSSPLSGGFPFFCCVKSLSIIFSVGKASDLRVKSLAYRLTYICSSRMVAIASLRLTEGKRSGLSQSDAWNLSTCDWITASNVSVMYLKWCLSFNLVCLATLICDNFNTNCFKSSVFVALV